MKFLQRMAMLCCAATIGALAPATCGAQETFPVNGVVNKQLVRTALEHATVHVNAQQVLEDATVVIYQGRIEQVGLASEPCLFWTGRAPRHAGASFVSSVCGPP